MRRIPSWMIKNISREKYDELLDWRLTAKDVALIMGVSVDRVIGWSNQGRSGWKLRYRTFSKRPGAARSYRLFDVQEFADNICWGLDYTLLHPALQREWGVGIFGRSDAEHDTLGTLTNTDSREEHHDENSPPD